MPRHLVVCACTCSVSDELHAANHLSDGEETHNLGSNNTGSRELLVVKAAELADGLEGVGCSCSAGVPQPIKEVLSVCLESGHVTVCRQPIILSRDTVSTDGGLIFCPWKINFPSSSPTLE